MGVVYTWDEIKNLRLPADGIHDDVAAKLRMELPQVDGVCCATFYGSYIHGDFNRLRSDMDCFVLFKAGMHGEPFASLRMLTEWAAARNVRLAFTPCNTAFVQTLAHRVGPQFYRHLVYGFENGGVICGDFSEYVFSTESSWSELISYLRAKYYNLTEMCTRYSVLSDAEKACFLQKVIEAPMHVARGVVERRLSRRIGPKVAVLNAYQAQMPSDLFVLLVNLLQLDSEYSACVQDALIVKADELHYRNVLAQIFAQTEKTIAFIAQNLLLLDDEH
ncbi:hypothetical protein KC902_01270 [Candidatus Kaiserbacteria bacterium]|nr:hypothetical protein [Candidatus Kaiserbacteria bacterium]USN88565.1 MAG: hypothetical protein H6780_03705 [Candidatus Nomurabacteria bacterium]